eukprot:XP_011674921.1 PREDICTED: uncharacterized protein LOC105443464 [Strongylocentrotus purpuratus]
MAEKQNRHYSGEVARYEETIAQLQTDLDQAKDQIQTYQEELALSQGQLQVVRHQLMDVKGQHEEAMDQLGERATLAAKLQSELTKADQQNHSFSKEVRTIKEKRDESLDIIQRLLQLHQATHRIHTYKRRTDWGRHHCHNIGHTVSDHCPVYSGQGHQGVPDQEGWIQEPRGTLVQVPGAQWTRATAGACRTGTNPGFSWEEAM